MKKISFIVLLLVTLFMLPFYEAQSATIVLNADTAETGMNLDSAPLLTPYGTVTYNGGYIEGDALTPSWLSTGLAFTNDTAINQNSYAEFIFEFNVESITFNFGGLQGGIYAEALDSNGAVIDSFHTTNPVNISDGYDQSEQPAILSGSGIRRFTFVDGRMGGYSLVDNVSLTTSAAPIAPEPVSSILFIAGGTLFAGRRYIKRKKKA